MIKNGMMQRRLFLIGASALTLAACGGGNLLGPPDAGPIYPLRPNFAAATGGEKIGWSMSVLRPNLPGALDTDRIALIQADGTMDYFAKATYPDRLPALIQNAFLDAYETSGRIGAVSREQDALHADYDLVTEITDFEAKYGAPDSAPQVVVTINAKLATAHGRKIVSSFSTSQTGSASANSTLAVTQALQQALGAAVTAIVNWTLTAPPPPMLPSETVSPGKPAEQLLHDVTRGSRRARDSMPTLDK